MATVALIATFFLLFVVSLVFFTYRSHEETERRARDRAFAASQVVELNAKSVVDLASQTLKRIDAVLGRNLSRRVTRSEGRDLGEALGDLPIQVKAYVVNAEGETLYSTDPQVKPIDIRDREYFRAPAEGAPLHVSGMMVSRLNGEAIFTVSSRIERDKEFAGVAILSFDVAQFRQIAASLELDDDSTVSIVRKDGTIVARYPAPAAPMNISDSPLFTQHLARSDSGTYRATSVADGIERFVGYRRVPNTDLIAIASISTRSAMAAFWRNTLLTFAFALPAAIGLAIASLWIGRLLRRESQRQAQLTRALELNRLLFRDTHHRVKNNLQSVQSLVRMQSIPPEAKLDLQRRIAAMTAVHEHMYRADQYTDVNAAEFIPAIVNPLLQSFDSDVELTFDIDPVTVDRDHTTALALLVNEVVTNSLKYAFAGKTDGHITISLIAVGDNRAKLRIRDNGHGFDPSSTAKGMGSRLIAGMMQQLGGEYEYRNDNGTVFTAELTMKSAADSVSPSGSTPMAEAAE